MIVSTEKRWIRGRYLEHYGDSKMFFPTKGTSAIGANSRRWRGRERGRTVGPRFIQRNSLFKSSSPLVSSGRNKCLKVSNGRVECILDEHLHTASLSVRKLGRLKSYYRGWKICYCCTRHNLIQGKGMTYLFNGSRNRRVLEL
jgi:hypothetical protein